VTRPAPIAPAVTIAVAAAAVVVTALTPALGRAAPVLWPITHAGWAHLALDVAALLAIGWVYERRAGAARWAAWLALVAGAGVVVGLGASVGPVLGLSAAAHGLLVAAGFGLERRAGVRRVVLAGVAAKVLVELAAGMTFASLAHPWASAGRAGAVAHAAGAIAGVVLGLAAWSTRVGARPSPQGQAIPARLSR